MKAWLATLVPALLVQTAFAKPPSQRIVDSCLMTESVGKVTYRQAKTDGFHVYEEDHIDTHVKKVSTTIRHGKETVGIWRVNKPAGRGLVYNGKEMAFKKVPRLHRRHEPSEFTPYTAMWGIAGEGRHSYFCITFTFDGIGSSGSYQNIRGLYLIDRTSRQFTPWFTAGDIRAIKK